MPKINNNSIYSTFSFLDLNTIMLLSLVFEYRIFVILGHGTNWIFFFILIISRIFYNKDGFTRPSKDLTVTLIAFLTLAILSLCTQYFNNLSMLTGLKYFIKFFLLGISLLLLHWAPLTEKDIGKAISAHATIYFIYILIALLFSLFGLNPLFINAGDNRIGTLFNFPGTLCYAGLWIYLYSLSRMIAGDIRKNIPLSTIGVFLISLDGSRSTFLIFLLLTFLAPLLYKKKIWEVFKIWLLIMTILFLSTVTCSFTLTHQQAALIERSISGLKTFARIYEGVSPIQSEDNSNNVLRSNMLLEGKEIFNQPFFGQGIDTANFAINGIPQVIHNIYIQLLKNYGILGLFSICVTFIFLFKKSLALKSSQEAINIFTILVSMVYPITFIFHPVSTEISIWLFPFAMATLKINNK